MENKSKKEEIIDIARNLFYTKGYTNTSIQNVIDIAQIAKGTFYHYFKSKDDLLNQMTSKDIEGVYEINKNILDLELNATEKLNKTFQLTSNWKSENLQLMKVLVASVMSDSNIQLRHVLYKETKKKMMPIYEEIINQGVKEGLFKVKDPVFSAMFLVSSFTQNVEEIQRILFSGDFNQDLVQDFKKLLFGLEDLIERILGAKESTIHIVDDVVLEKLLKGLLEA